MAQILVTNASDVLGKRIIRELAKRGHTITTTLTKNQDALIICSDISVQRTKDLVKEARKEKLKHIIFISSQRASPRSRSRRLVTKYEEELIIKQSNIAYTIFRPGVIISRARLGPRFPIPGLLAQRGLHPTYVDDLVRSIATAVDTKPKNKTSEIPGREKLTIRELLSLVKKSIKHRPR